MSPRSVFPRTLVDMKAWIGKHPNLKPIHGGRVFFRVPDYAWDKGPVMRIYRAGGAVQTNSEAPMQDIRLSVEAWVKEWDNYPVITDLCSLLEDACTNVQAGSLINPVGNTILDNASFNTAFDSPDPDTGYPRIVCDIVVTVKAAFPTVITLPT